MERHPHFDLRLHSDAELADLIGLPVVERVTLHKWPLSCVQRVTDAGGRWRIYKAQAGPTVEDRFYAAARSPLLPAAETVYAEDGYVCLFIEYLEGSHPSQDALSEAEAVQIGHELLDQIAAIEGDLPAYQIMDGRHWGRFTEGLLSALAHLSDSGAFTQVDEEVIATIRRACNDDAVLAHVEGEAGLLHGDLTPDNLFMTEDGYRLIDWQYARRGPRLIDLAVFLESMGYDPTQHVGTGIVRLTALMRIHWLVECAANWFPPGVDMYDREIARLARGLAARHSTST